MHLLWLLVTFTHLVHSLEPYYNNNTRFHPIIRKIFPKPSKNSDGTCAPYIVKSGDSCYLIAAHYSLTQDELIKFNENHSYNWNGCDKLAIGQGLCLSDGTPPKPKSDPKAECGPYAPGDWTKPPECPNKACCSEWGYCGLTAEFCDKSAKCFSNCGYGNLHGDTRGDFENIAYWLDAEGKLASDPQLLNDKYTKVHYAFVNINSDFSIDESKFSKSGFLDIKPKKIASFGGWDFSTNPSTYKIFRDGTNANNREKLTSNIANFASRYNLDGIDIDWEYPAEPDIPDIPADSKDSIDNYVEFIKLLKSKLGSRTLSIAIPSSFWYSKGFKLVELDKYIDYKIFMTYDIYGVWDQQKDNHIRCHANKTAIVDAMKMLDKAGSKIGNTYVGISNYGRSYKASSSSCLKENCPFSGPGNSRDMTNTPGVLSDSEIIDISASSAKNDRWTEPISDCIFMRYDQDSIVSWTRNRNDLVNFIKSHGFKGSVLWVDNYYKHNDYINTDDPTYECNLILNDDEIYFSCFYTIGANKDKVINRDKLNDLFDEIRKEDGHYSKYFDEGVYITLRLYLELYKDNKFKKDRNLTNILKLWAILLHNYKLNKGKNNKKENSYLVLMLLSSASPTIFNDCNDFINDFILNSENKPERIEPHWGDLGTTERLWFTGMINSYRVYLYNMYKMLNAILSTLKYTNKRGDDGNNIYFNTQQAFNLLVAAADLFLRFEARERDLTYDVSNLRDDIRYEINTNEITDIESYNEVLNRATLQVSNPDDSDLLPYSESDDDYPVNSDQAIHYTGYDMFLNNENIINRNRLNSVLIRDSNELERHMNDYYDMYNNLNGDIPPLFIVNRNGDNCGAAINALRYFSIYNYNMYRDRFAIFTRRITNNLWEEVNKKRYYTGKLRKIETMDIDEFPPFKTYENIDGFDFVSYMAIFDNENRNDGSELGCFFNNYASYRNMFPAIEGYDQSRQIRRRNELIDNSQFLVLVNLIDCDNVGNIAAIPRDMKGNNLYDVS